MLGTKVWHENGLKFSKKVGIFSKMGVSPKKVFSFYVGLQTVFKNFLPTPLVTFIFKTLLIYRCVVPYYLKVVASTFYNSEDHISLQTYKTFFYDFEANI